MSVFGFFRRRQPATARLRVCLEEREFSFVDDDGAELHGYGFSLRNTTTGEVYEEYLSHHSEELAAAGAWVVRVAGVSYRMRALADEAFDPGQPLRLIPEPDNDDPNAIGVWSADGTQHAGYVPADVAPLVVAQLRSGALDALVLWEWRRSGGERCGLKILLFPPELIP